MIFPPWLVEKLIFIVLIVQLLFLFELLLDISFKPVLCALTLIGLLDKILMFVFNMLDYEILALKDLLAYFTAVSLVWDNFFAFVSEEIFFVLIDEFLFWIDKLARAICNFL